MREVDPAAGHARQEVRHGVRIDEAETGENGRRFFKNAVAIRVFEIEHLGPVGDEDAVFIRQDTLRHREPLGDATHHSFYRFGRVVDDDDAIGAFVFEFVEPLQADHLGELVDLRLGV